MPPSARLLHLACAMTLLAGTCQAHGEAWPANLDASLTRAGIPRSATSLLVRDLDGSAALVSHRTGEAMNPASVMKLVTAYVALDQLGPSFTWKTRIAASGDIRTETLNGNLFIVGSGDPRLSRERLWLLLRDLRSRGIRHIDGDVITDRNLFRLPPHDPAAFDQRPLRPYNVGADTLTVDYGAIQLRVTPMTTGATVGTDPLPAGLLLNNRIRRNGNGNSNCTDPLTHLTATATDTIAGTLLTLDGSLPPSCSEVFDWNLAPIPPRQLFEGMFRTLWQELGGEISGRFRDGRTPPDARPLAESVSPSLPEVLRDMNKWSNNVIARHVLATLGASAEPDQDAPAAGARRVQRTLAASGVATDGLVVENGAGLSRTERITANTLGQVLVAAWRSPTMPELLSSLPIAGRDGTARRRVANSPAAGYAHVKTGTLDGVRSMAGYVLARNGHRYAVVLMINHPNAGAARDAQDALLEWVAGL
ncbi:D-alanyl-D-alanine carboxypeptidase/D-alanyl-D-alanine-endopeptidase [Zoogloea sp.]|uniref:D-alanyl-D-alanine carboxypeptidase/D-alanyl-D-alanine endopeptidase n=1 Tax=Zoogloea sp. TaxID=49181 RepID=UPI00258CEB4F|nr:D-alanyl-D-alanine carboxypeptidase/D-alanyl-D-alanine-endopeptidase [Zoogloea sp.]MDD2669305.1 D-alanyl-D-alanine carboxypeptidase/D-alanyl-D-alanine-endopeptidase [Zoogloea sp.]